MAHVKIGCKLPNGIWLELIEAADPATPLNVKPTGPRVRLRGANDSSVYVPNTNPAVLPYAFTLIDKAFWDKWIKHPGNEDLAFMKNGSVFVAAEEAKEAAAKAKDHAAVTTGFEPLAPRGDGTFKDARMPLSVAADQGQMEKLARREVVA